MKGAKIPDVFATRDEDLHRRMRRPVANLYSIANLTRFEPLVVSTIEYFFSRLDEMFTDKGRGFNLSDWLQLFTFDIMGEVTFSRRLGFLEKGGDIEGVIENNWKYFRDVAAVSSYLPYDSEIVLVSTSTNDDTRTLRHHGWTSSGRTTRSFQSLPRGILSPSSARHESRSGLR